MILAERDEDAEEQPTDYVVYCVGDNAPEWKLNISQSLRNEKISQYIEQITQGVEVSDPKGNLLYLAVEASASSLAAELPEE